ncbi:ATP-binding protein [Chlorobium phaeovibrioides]|nr:ATP-binding protein [Chlorobium phaeovibrioides]
MMTFRQLPATNTGDHSMTQILSATLKAELKNSRIAANIARSTAEVFAEERHFSGNVQEFGHTFELAVSEAFTNSVNYRDPSIKDITVTIGFEEESNALTASVTDMNAPFNIHPPEPEITEYPEGGFGLLIIWKLMDEVSCSREGQSNVLSMKKFISRP